MLSFMSLLLLPIPLRTARPKGYRHLSCAQNVIASTYGGGGRGRTTTDRRSQAAAGGDAAPGAGDDREAPAQGGPDRDRARPGPPARGALSPVGRRHLQRAGRPRGPRLRGGED